MNLKISQFFPVYPDIKDPEFNCKLNAKREFTELSRDAKLKNELYPHQEITRRYFKPQTGYTSGLFFQEVGTGKSISGLAIAEDYMGVEGYGKPLILTKGQTIQYNIKSEISKYTKLTREKIVNKKKQKKDERSTRGKNIAFTKEIGRTYEIHNYKSFSNMIQTALPDHLKKMYSNRVIIIDEVHNLRTTKEGKKTAYDNLHRFLHLVENCIIILLSATPMVDNVFEIASIMNLILPLNNQMNIEEIREVMRDRTENKRMSEKEKKRITELHEKEIFDYFEPYFRGRVSYVRQPKSMPRRIDMGEEFEINEETITRTKIVGHKMSDHQTSVYESTLTSEANVDLLKNPEEKIKTDFALYSRYALNFAFPQKLGIKNPKYSDYVEEIPGSGGEIRFKDPKFAKSLSDLDKMAEYSAKYAGIIKTVMDTPKECAYLYNYFVDMGSDLLGLCFQTQGYEMYNGKIILNPAQKDDDEKTLKTRTLKKKRFAYINTNTTKEQIKNIIKSFNLRENAYGEYLQVIIGSPRSGEGLNFLNVRQVHIVQSGWHDAGTVQAIGRAFRATSHQEFSQEEKYVKIYLHASYSDYIEEGEQPYRFTKDIEMYYLSELKALKINQVENIMKSTAFDCFFNAHRNIRSESDPKCMSCSPQLPEDLTSYHMYYGKQLMSQIIHDIKQLYLKKFSLSFDEISSYLSQYDPSSILLSLNHMLDTYQPIQNRFGFLTYLKHDNNIFFLQNTQTVGSSASNHLSSIYSENYIVPNGLRLSEYIYDINLDISIKFLNDTLSLSSDDFKSKFLELNMDTKIVLMEHILVDPLFYPDRRSILLKLMSNNWFLFEDSNCIVHILDQLNLDKVHYTANLTKLTPQGKLRMYCFDDPFPEWRYVSDKQDVDFIQAINSVLLDKEMLIADQHSVYGILNTSDNLFRIKDRMKRNDKKKSNGSPDIRGLPRGFICKDGPKSTLINYLWNFNIPPPHFDDKTTISEITSVLRNKKFSLRGDARKYRFYYSWYKRHINDMCNTLRNYFVSIDALLIK